MSHREKGNDSAKPKNNGHLRYLVLLAITLWLIYGAITWFSSQFNLTNPGQNRPIPLVLSLFSLAFLLYLGAIALVVRVPQSSRLFYLIIGASIAFRLTVLFSTPIQEVDLHRYIWDGVVCAEGISPYRYPPDQVLAAGDHSPVELQRLAEIRDTDEGLNYILQELNKHFGYLPTVYPPTSQAVFALSAYSTPDGASYTARVRIMKAWLVLFDVGVILILIRLLSLCRKPIGLSIAYAWCPLVIKEVANSGHLDAIAVFFSTCVVYLLASAMVNNARPTNSAIPRVHWNTLNRALAAISLAAAVGAKLYPIVLAPLVLLISIRQFGWQKTILPGIVFTASTLVLIWPMLPNSVKQDRPKTPLIVADSAMEAPETDPSTGLTTFLQYWEMNDFLFMVAVENLKPAPDTVDPNLPPPPDIWFSKVPESSRQAIVQPISRYFSSIEPGTQKTVPMQPSLAAFLVTRTALSLLFLGLALWFAWKHSGNSNPSYLGHAAFLTLAWFWLLSPTQNPWYWMWALPFLPFAKSRAWYALSGLAMVYYLRFWLEYHRNGIPVAGTHYQGTAYFDFVVTWLEFAPWFLWLTIEGYLRRKQKISQLNPQTAALGSEHSPLEAESRLATTNR